MDILNSLRRLAEYRKYSELTEYAEEYWSKSRKPAVLPLLLMALILVGKRKRGLQVLSLIQNLKEKLDSDALVDYGGALIVLMRFDEAMAQLEEALNRHPEHALGLSRLGYCHMILGELPTAESLLQRAIELAPQHLPTQNNLATVYLLMDKPNTAQRTVSNTVENLTRLKKELPEDVIAHHHQTIHLMQLQIWVAKKEFATAENWLSKMARKEGEPEIIAWVKHYSRYLAEADHHEQAEDILREYLGRYPDNSTILLKMAELARMHGRFIQAVALLRRDTNTDERNIATWVELSGVCLHRNNKLARVAAEKAMALVGELSENEKTSIRAIQLQRAKAQNAMAQVESQEQNYDEADRLFRKILEENEFFLPALQGLGQQEMQLGNIDKAMSLFERIKHIDPVKGNSMLINARRFPEDIESLIMMEKSAEIPSLEGSVRSGILFHLSSAWEKRKEYDKAMALAHQANQVSKRFLSYDPKAHRNQCARIRDVFSPPLYEHRKGCGHDSILPVYVLGMPRSGTSLVEQIIAGHNKIFGAGELGVIPCRIQGLNRWERHVGSDRTYPDCIDDLNPIITKGIANGILEELRELAAEEKPEAEFVVDKLPHNFENIGFIKFLFPKAKIISVRRDPRDIAISNYFTDYHAKHGGMGFAYDLTDIGEQLADHNLLMHHWNHTFPGQILEIKYEDVVDDLEGSARRLLDYIGVEWQDEVLAFNTLDRPVKTASVWQVRQPIYKTSKARWKHYTKYLAPLLQGTNAKITWDPIHDRIILPEPAYLQDGVAFYKKNDLAGAELCFKKMLHHNPDHAACNYMLGLVYCSIGEIHHAIPLMEKALRKCPWQKEWRDNLIRAYREGGCDEKIEQLNATTKLWQESGIPRSDGTSPDPDIQRPKNEHWTTYTTHSFEIPWGSKQSGLKA